MASAGAAAACKREDAEETQISVEEERNPSVSAERRSASAFTSVDCDQWRLQCRGVDRMLKNELDAARALADLSQMAAIDAGSFGWREKPVIKGSWSQKLAANESLASAPDRGKEISLSPCTKISSSNLPLPSDPIQNHPLEAYQCYKKVGQYMENRSVKGQMGTTISNSNLSSSNTRVSFCRGKSRKHLTEAELEAKRLRRVLANRESARQTILRRQAFCEELTRKASDLAWENEGMKQERELFMDEYKSLKDQNKHLKIQLSKMIKGEDEKIKKEEEIENKLEETPLKVISAHMETPSSVQMQQPAYSRPPFMPFVWSPLYPFQTHPFPPNATESKNWATTGTAYQLRNPGQDSTGRPRIPFHVLPNPWCFAPPNMWPGPFPGDPQTSREKSSIDFNIHSNVGPSSRSTANIERASGVASGKQDSFSSTETTAKRENASNVITDSAFLTLGPCNKNMDMAPSTNTMQPTFTVKRENRLQVDSDLKAVSSSENLKGTSGYPSRKLVGASMAAEARKRRKELIKLKNQHAQKFQLL